MSGHTPGPWRYKPATNLMHAVMSIGDKIAIFKVAPDDSDARLMEAAPELLAALEEMVRWYAKRETASMAVSGGEGLLPIEVQDEEVQQAMRAIAKATGETP